MAEQSNATDDTPRTDAACQDEPRGPSVNAEFARQLERELAFRNRQYDDLWADIQRERTIPSAIEQSADAERYRFMRSKLCNRESLEFDRFPNVLNLAGLASIKPSEIDAAVDAMREEK